MGLARIHPDCWWMHSSCFSAALDLSSAESAVLICSKELLGANPGLQCLRSYDPTEVHAGSRQKIKIKTKQKHKSQESHCRLLIQIKHTATCPALHHVPHCFLTQKHNLGKWKLQSFDDFKSEHPERFAKQAHMESEQLHSEYGSVTIPAEGLLEWLTI